MFLGPFWIVGVLHTKKTNILKSENLQRLYDRTYESLYLGLRTTSDGYKQYYSVFLMRKCIFGAMVFFFYDSVYTFAQVQITMFMSFIFLIYLMHEKPFLDATSQKLQVFNEICFYIITSIQIGFTDHGTNIDTKLMMGWFFVYLNVIMVVPNVIFYLGLSLPYLFATLRPKTHDKVSKLEMSRKDFLEKHDRKLKTRFQNLHDIRNHAWIEKKQPRWNQVISHEVFPEDFAEEKRYGNIPFYTVRNERRSREKKTSTGLQELWKFDVKKLNLSAIYEESKDESFDNHVNSFNEIPLEDIEEDENGPKARF